MTSRGRPLLLGLTGGREIPITIPSHSYRRARTPAGRTRDARTPSRQGRCDFATIGRFAMHQSPLALALDQFAYISGHVRDEQTQGNVGESDGDDDRKGRNQKDDDGGHTWTG